MIWQGRSYVHGSTHLCTNRNSHYYDVIMGAISSQITSLKIVYWIVNSGTDQRKYQSSASLGIHRSIWWRHLEKWTVIFRVTNVNIMAAISLAPCITKSSAAMMLTLYDKCVPVFYEEASSLPPQCQSWVLIQIFQCYLNSTGTIRVKYHVYFILAKPF